MSQTLQFAVFNLDITGFQMHLKREFKGLVCRFIIPCQVLFFALAASIGITMNIRKANAIHHSHYANCLRVRESGLRASLGYCHE